eukprot:m.307091 g.307091  ORF g.307091 m.307091 type:complete len:368 (+) comp55311_c0_seq6:446-1549(+)
MSKPTTGLHLPRHEQLEELIPVSLVRESFNGLHVVEQRHAGVLGIARDVKVLAWRSIVARDHFPLRMAFVNPGIRPAAHLVLGLSFEPRNGIRNATGILADVTLALDQLHHPLRPGGATLGKGGNEHVGGADRECLCLVHSGLGDERRENELLVDHDVKEGDVVGSDALGRVSRHPGLDCAHTDIRCTVIDKNSRHIKHFKLRLMTVRCEIHTAHKLRGSIVTERKRRLKGKATERKMAPPLATRQLRNENWLAQDYLQNEATTRTSKLSAWVSCQDKDKDKKKRRKRNPRSNGLNDQVVVIVHRPGFLRSRGGGNGLLGGTKVSVHFSDRISPGRPHVWTAWLCGRRGSSHLTRPWFSMHFLQLER